MSLATRCAHCGTVFKVVQDQLKVSEGWVRCGRCNEVFHALPALFDLDQEQPPADATFAHDHAGVVMDEQPQVEPEPFGNTEPEGTPPDVWHEANEPLPTELPTSASSASFATPVEQPWPAPWIAPDLLTLNHASVDLPLDQVDDGVYRDEAQPAEQPAAFWPDEEAPAQADTPWPEPQPLTAPSAWAAMPHDALAGSATDPAPIDLSEPAPRLPREPEPPAVRPAAIEFDLDLELDLPPLDDDEHDQPAMLSAAPSATSDTAPGELALPATSAAPFEHASPVAAPEPLQDEPPPQPPPAETEDSANRGHKRAASSGRERKAAFPRPVGPEFADAEFPSDALADMPAEGADHPIITPLHPSGLTAPAAAAGTNTLLRGSDSDTAAPALNTPDTQPAAPTQVDTPNFLKQAHRQAFWHHPGTRAALFTLSLLLSAGLLLQLAHQFRDLIAAHHPPLRPYLVQWCDAVGCQLAPPMRLDDLQVESATLTRSASEGSARYKLTVVVHNRAPIDLAWPQVDLTLTDTRGTVVARRVVNPQEARWLDSADTPSDDAAVATARAKLPTAAPRQRSSTLQWSLRLDGLEPTGYTAELFYP